MKSIAELTNLQEEILALQGESDVHKKAMEKIDETLKKKKAELLAIMVESKLDNFKTKSGTIILNKKFQITVPKGDDLDAFFKYLGDQDPGAATALRTVNYATLNSWYREKLDEAGEAAPFLQIPGIAAPTLNEYLSIRRIG